MVSIVPSGKILILELLRFAQELRSSADLNIPQESAKELKITSKEVDMANQLIESMTEKWRPEQYHDDYREALMAWIDSKAKGKKTKEKVVKLQTTKASEDLIALMKKSIQALKTTQHSSNVVPLKQTRTRGKK